MQLPSLTTIRLAAVVGVVALSAVLPMAASAAPTIISPAANGATDWMPAFSWSVGEGETTDHFWLSDERTVDSGGVLRGSVVADFDTTAANFRYTEEYLEAGPYYWQVSSKTPVGEEFVTPVSAFRVKPMITSTPLKVRKYRYIAVEPGTRHTVSLDAVIKCNFHDPVVTWYVKRGAKTIFWTGGKKQECGGKARGFPVGGAWYNTQVPAGTKVTITMVVKGTTGAGKGASYTTAPVAWKAT